MPNHIHLMISAKKGYSLSSILRDFKKYTAHLILEDLQKNDFGQSSEMLNIFRETGQVNPNNKHFQLWIQNNRPMEVTSNKFYTQKMDYIHHNPVKAGLCANPKDYPYSSARWFLDKTGLIQIDEILI